MDLEGRVAEVHRRAIHSVVARGKEQVAIALLDRERDLLLGLLVELLDLALLVVGELA